MMASPVSKQAKKKTSESSYSRDDLIKFFADAAESPDSWTKHVGARLTAKRLPLAITAKFMHGPDGKLASAHLTLGTCVLGSVPSHEVGESVDAAGERAALDPTSAIRFPDRHRVGKPFLPFQEEIGKHVDV